MISSPSRLLTYQQMRKEQISSRVRQSVHLSNRQYWHKLKTLPDVSARKDPWILVLWLLTDQRMGSDSPDRLLVHLNLDRCHDAFLNTLLWNGHSYGLPSDIYVFHTRRFQYNIIFVLFFGESRPGRAGVGFVTHEG